MGQQFNYDISFDEEDAYTLAKMIRWLVPDSNLVTGKTAEEQYNGLNGKLKAFLNAVECFIGREDTIKVLEIVLEMMANDEEDDFPPDDDDDDDLADYFDEDIADYFDEDGEFDIAAYVHDQDSDYPMNGW